MPLCAAPRFATAVLAFLAGIAALAASPVAAQATGYCEIPASPALSPGYRIEEKVLHLPHGPRWFCQVTPPGYSIANPDYPLVIVFHGGGGQAETMMRPQKAILEQIVNRGYVGVFPIGIPREGCDLAALPCETNAWGDDTNLAFLNALLEYAAQFNLDEDRIFLAGFSGGAQFIYRAIAEDDFALPITGIATAAGIMGMMKTGDPGAGLPLTNVALGQPVHAMLLQATDDPNQAYGGGLATAQDELHLPFSLKVDLFRLMAGSLRTPMASIAGLPAGTTGTIYLGGTHEVRAITTTGGHTWPNTWFAPLVFDFFDRF
ncbi:MAG TPA: hypothetical protein PKD10_16595 [Paracoccaceae bacterium]|nr:hypothetical protein [Paracoccaceae bacterium]HMO70428.1 hypothetical protein [Paracoccaceae bacterium]